MGQLLVRSEIEFDPVVVIEREYARVGRRIMASRDLHMELADAANVVDYAPEN